MVFFFDTFSQSEKCRALKLLLTLNRWDEAIELVASYMDKEVYDHYELFHCLFTFYLETQISSPDSLSKSNNLKSTSLSLSPSPQPPNLLEKIWQVMPRNYSIYELMTLLKNADERQGNADMLCAQGNQLNLGSIINQLLTMFARESRGRSFSSPSGLNH